MRPSHDFASAHIRLRPTAADDLPFVLATEHDEENSRFILPWERERHEAALGNPDIRHLIVEAAESAEPVGYVIVAGLQNPHHSIELMRITVARKGHGYGRAALQLVKELAFTQWGAHRLWLDVKEQNHRAQRLYLSEGFVLEGTLRECLKTGDAYESLHVMSILRGEYERAALKPDHM